AATAFDLFRFIGIAQALAFLEGKELPLLSEPLNTGGVYRIVRHPLYFFSLLIIWPNPTMTTTLLAFNLAATLYFFIGSRVEEQRLLAMHGEDYAKYPGGSRWHHSYAVKSGYGARLWYYCSGQIKIRFRRQHYVIKKS
ncbi:MAG: methyltransferase family protein, partial [Anaerolineae bacterium]